MGVALSVTKAASIGPKAVAAFAAAAGWVARRGARRLHTLVLRSKLASFGNRKYKGRFVGGGHFGGGGGGEGKAQRGSKRESGGGGPY